MSFIINSLTATVLLFLFLQVGIASCLLESPADLNRLKDSSKTSHSTNQSRVNNHSTIIDSDSYDTIHRPNVTVEVNNSTISRLFYRRNDNGYEIIEGTDRRKRDIRNDILVNELQNVVKIYNSEITTQVKSAVNSIVSQSDGLNGLRNLLTFSFSNLATNGLNDLSSMASKLPIAIQNCYNLYGFKFSDVISLSKMMAGQCLSNKVNEAKSIVEDFRYSITNAVDNVKDVSKQIAQCQLLANLYPSIAGLIAKASCLNIAIFSIRAETVLLPLKFATLVAQTYNYILTIQSGMNKCGLEIINTILDQSIQSGRAINNCINEQNGATNNTLFIGSNNAITTTVSPPKRK